MSSSTAFWFRGSPVLAMTFSENKPAPAQAGPVELVDVTDHHASGVLPIEGAGSF